MRTKKGSTPVHVQPLFWLVAIFIGWSSTRTLTGTAIAVGVVFLSVLVHEFGHALTARLFGQKTRIELAAFGGFTYREGRKLRLGEEFLVVLNGPIAGFLLCIAAYAVYHLLSIQNPLILFALRFTYVANLFWTVVNLVPVLPLDGGHLLSIVLEALFGFTGIRISIFVGIIVAACMSLLFFLLGMYLAGALFLILLFESCRSLRYYKLFKEKDRDADLQGLLKLADANLQAGKPEEALSKLELVRSRTREGILYTMATQEMAAIYHSQEKYQNAYALLKPIQKELSGDALSLFHYLAYATGDCKTAIRVGNQCYQENPTYDTALINAFAYAGLSRAKPAVGWLECALREGLPSLTTTLRRKEFDPIRKDPKFQALQEGQDK